MAVNSGFTFSTLLPGDIVSKSQMTNDLLH